MRNEQNLYDIDDFFKDYKELRGQPHNYNNLLEQPAIKALLPPLNGKKVLDLGCGFRDLARHCAAAGARLYTPKNIR